MNYSILYSGIKPDEGHVVKPIEMLQSEMTIGCLPKWICKTCRQDTKGYDETCCERCAEGYTKAFYNLAEEYLGIKVTKAGGSE